jgi:hypothetical protein
MALNFPSSPTIGQVYTDSTSGFSYEWDGTVWRSFSPSSSSNIKILDDFSGSFNGVQAIFALTSNGSSLTPPSSQSLVINLGGVIQDPSDDYSVSSSNIIFSTAPVNGLSFSGVSLGPAIPINTIPDGTTTDGSLIVSNNLNVTGIVTATAFVGDGSGLTGAGSTVGIDTTTNDTFYPLFTQTTSGTVTSTNVANSKLTFNPSLGKLTATAVNSSSDENLKKDIATIENALEKVNQLRGVEFTWKDNNEKSMGLIAQELQKVFPELVSEDQNGLSINYNGLIGVLIQAIKELTDK